MYLFILPHCFLSHPLLPDYNEIPMYFFPQKIKEHFDFFNYGLSPLPILFMYLNLDSSIEQECLLWLCNSVR